MPGVVHTEDKLEYQFFPVDQFELNVSVKAPHNAHIALAPGATADAGKVIEIFLGGWEGTKSAIRLNKEKPDKAEADTPGLLTDSESQDFIIRWNTNGLLEVFLKDAVEPFLSFTDSDPFPITHFGLRTSWGATGEWKIDGIKEVQTPDSNDYTFFPIFNGNLNIFVRAQSNAHLALTPGPADEVPCAEIFLGGWDNTKSAIRYNKEKPDKAEAETPQIVNDQEYKNFVISWNYALLQVKAEGSAEPILLWNEPEPFVVTHYGIRTGWGAQGEWFVQAARDDSGIPAEIRARREITEETTEDEVTTTVTEGSVSWVQASNGEVPDGSLVGGDDNGEPIVVARAGHEGALLVGKLIAAHGVCYVPWGGEEHSYETYETLVVPADAVSWVPSSGSEVPANAIPGGSSLEGETLYIGRVPHEGTITVGKVHPSHETCYISYGGEEHGYPDYEILVLN